MMINRVQYIFIPKCLQKSELMTLKVAIQGFVQLLK